MYYLNKNDQIIKILQLTILKMDLWLKWCHVFYDCFSYLPTFNIVLLAWCTGDVFPTYLHLILYYWPGVQVMFFLPTYIKYCIIGLVYRWCFSYLPTFNIALSAWCTGDVFPTYLHLILHYRPGVQVMFFLPTYI